MTTYTVGRGPGLRTLSDLDDDDRNAAFAQLQQRMVHVWEGMRRDLGDESVVVVPSITTARSGTLTQAMEERSLFLLLLLRQPRLRMIYVTSCPVSEAVVEYYLGLLPGVIPRHARARLTMVSLNDATPGSLSAKLLARPRILRDIRRLIPNRAACHLIPYNATALERDVALTLGIPMYAADPRHLWLGTKTGCRRMFEELGIPCPAGAEDLRTLEDIIEALVGMRRRRPDMVEAIAKLNDGVSGSGNAVIDLRDLPAPGATDEPDALRHRVLGMALEDSTIGVDAYLASFESGAGIVEERITGRRLTSPSVQMRALPDGTVELLSTHDQLLGGASGQSYLGCIFPADRAYGPLISEPALVVGRHLATLGVQGRFAVDFVTVQDDDGAWAPYAIELNLRKGGTTHPFLTLQFLTDGTYDATSGVFRTPNGHPKHLVATDHLEDDRLTTLTVDDVFDIVARRRLHFDATRQTGVVLHMISCVTECGRLGLTAVGDSPEEAWRLYEEARVVILDEAEVARSEGLLFP
ncbi:MAG: peptide ligase PGM1-related protein [Nocardioides sp.]